MEGMIGAYPPPCPAEVYPAGAACPLGSRDCPPAELYISDQVYGTFYSPADAFAKGTLFPELDKPCLH